MQQLLFSRLIALAEEPYRRFSSSLLPGLPPQQILGVRLPHLRRLAKELSPLLQAEGFLTRLPHEYHEEDLIHAFLLARELRPDALTEGLRLFLPHVTNWAVCDSLRPKYFARHDKEAPALLGEFVFSSHPYTCRFGMEMLMLHYLREHFDPVYFQWVAGQNHENYYVKMMQAWYFATALSERFFQTLSFLQDHPLSPWVQRKTLQKAKESLRLSAEQKKLLSELLLTDKT